MRGKVKVRKVKGRHQRVNILQEVKRGQVKAGTVTGN